MPFSMRLDPTNAVATGSEATTGLTEMEEFHYSGELELFEHAINWKRYWLRDVKRYLGRRVLENGAGIATNTRLLVSSVKTFVVHPSWSLASVVARTLSRMWSPPTGTTTLPPNASFQPDESSTRYW